MCADGLWLARPGSANDRRLTQSVADPVPVANLTQTDGRTELIARAFTAPAEC